MTSYPLVSRTLATLRMAELGFLGVRVMTWRQTPRRNGAFSKAGDLDLRFNLFRPFRPSWLIVGIAASAYAFLPFLKHFGNGGRNIANTNQAATTIWKNRAGPVWRKPQLTVFT